MPVATSKGASAVAGSSSGDCEAHGRGFTPRLISWRTARELLVSSTILTRLIKRSRCTTRWYASVKPTRERAKAIIDVDANVAVVVVIVLSLKGRKLADFPKQASRDKDI